MVLKSALAACLGVVLFAGASAQEAGAPGPSDLSASEILARAADVYGRCQSYRDAGVVEENFEHADNASRNFHTSKAFRTSFARSSGFRFEYSEGRGGGTSHYIIWQHGSEVRTWWDVDGGVSDPGSLAMAIGAAAGVSSLSAVTVPRMLMPLQVNGLGLANLLQPERLPDANLDDVPCLRVKGRWGSPTMLWIDRESFLLRRIERETELTDCRVLTTTTYEPEIDVEISAGELLFDPPRDATAPRTSKAVPSKREFRARIAQVMRHADAHEDDAALPDLEWLWSAMDDSDLASEPGNRSVVLSLIKLAALRHAATRVRFSEIFDELDATVRSGTMASAAAWTDWIDLGRALNRDDRIVQLYLDRRSPTGSLEPPKDIHPYAFEALREILIERGLLADAGRLCADPLKEAEIAYAIFKLPDEDDKDPGDWQDAIGHELLKARAEVSDLFALTLGAGRTDEAQSVARLMLEQDDTTEARRALVLACLHREVPCDWLPTWLAEIRRRGGDVSDIEALMAAPEAASDSWQR